MKFCLKPRSQAKVQKAQKKLKKTKLVHTQLMTEAGLLEWEVEEAKFRYQQMVPWKIDWAQIETPFPTAKAAF